MKLCSRTFLMTLSISVFLCACKEQSTDVTPTQPKPSPAPEKKVLYVDSYHEDYPWSNGITYEIKRVLRERQDVQLRIHRMDTKRHGAEDFKVKAGKQVHDLITQWKPDVVIASDDNASKYVIVPYYKGGDLPFVFCGVNWDASDYGFPARNVTGMIEVQLIDKLLDALKPYATKPGIGFLKGDDLSARKEAEQFEKTFSIDLHPQFVKNFDEWKEAYITMQDQVGILLLGNSASIEGWNGEEAKAFIDQHSKVPTGNWDKWMAEYGLITISTMPQEQGNWAATTALKILDGQSPEDIPLTKNKQAEIILNMRLAKAMNIRFPMELIQSADFISAEPD